MLSNKGNKHTYIPCNIASASNNTHEYDPHCTRLMYVSHTAPPDPPTNVWIASCGAAFTDVEWAFEDSQANFSPLLEFIVEYSTSHNPDVWSEAKRVFPESR